MTAITYLYEHGELYADERDALLARRFERKLGKLKGSKQGIPKDADNPYYITYRYYTTAPRNIAFRRRMFMKRSVAPYTKIVSLARKNTKTRFLAILRDHNFSTLPVASVLEAKVKSVGYKSLEHFWQVANNKKLKVPGYNNDNIKRVKK